MRYEFKPSFDRSVKSLPLQDKEDLLGSCLAFLDVLEKRSSIPSGIGLKRLQGDYWEIRTGLRNRVLFRWQEDVVEFILAGNHDSIRRYLKSS